MQHGNRTATQQTWTIESMTFENVPLTFTDLICTKRLYKMETNTSSTGSFPNMVVSSNMNDMPMNACRLDLFVPKETKITCQLENQLIPELPSSIQAKQKISQKQELYLHSNVSPNESLFRAVPHNKSPFHDHLQGTSSELLQLLLNIYQFCRIRGPWQVP